MPRSTALTTSGQPPGPLAEDDGTADELLDRYVMSGGGSGLPKLLLLPTLITAFIASFQLFSGGVAAWAVAALAAALLAPAGWVVWSWRRLLGRTAELNRLAERGELGSVVAQQREVAQRTRIAFWRLVTVHDLGYYELRHGNTDRALVLLSAVYRAAPDGRRGDHLRTATARNLSVAYLTRGDVDAAAAWLADESAPGLYEPQAAAALFAHRGEWDRVLALEWPRIQPRFDKALRHSRRSFYLLRAFARDQAGAPDPNALADELEAARPAFAGEYDYLSANWPELRAFVADRCLPPRPVADADELPPARTVRVR